MGWTNIGLFIANGQRIHYTSMGLRKLELFTGNGQRIIHTSMGWRKLGCLLQMANEYITQVWDGEIMGCL